ncbi:MAG: type IV secretory system conjugative DNA transfer family protein [Actinomycetota bacterium]|nr:type IV secretory system conjugative DNA transfer family protein [Actinomycetota bacterium]
MNPSDLLVAAALGAVPVASITGLVRNHLDRGAAGQVPRDGSAGRSRGGRPAPGPSRGRGRAPGVGPALRASTRAETGARWARRADLRPLARGADGTTGRLVLGTAAPEGLWRPGGRVLAVERAQSVAVVGPTQSGKTTALAVPAILGWDGPVLAASVKTDLVRDTLAWRRRCGTVWCFDPAGTTGLPRSRWSPLDTAGTWPGARRLAADLTDVTRADSTTADGEFWYATAAKLLAPLLFAAAVSRRSMHDVVRWVDEQETEEVLDVLHAAGVHEAIQAARATWLRDERQRSAIYTTAETVLEPFADMEAADVSEVAPGPLPGPAPGALPASYAPASPLFPEQSDTPPYGTPALRAGPVWGGPMPADPPGDDVPRGGPIDCARLISGSHTLYVCAPAHDQRRLRGLFVALVQQSLHAAFAHSARTGRPLDPPLLVVLDEAANIAPLRDLDGLAATCAGHGVQLVTVWQDLAQVRARYGERGATVVNNHRAKVFLPGIADPATLELASQLAGTEERPTPSVTYGARGERTVTTAPAVRRLLPPDALRRMSRGTAVLLYGSLPPARIRLRPWFEDRVMRERAGAPAPAPRRPRWRPLQSRA